MNAIVQRVASGEHQQRRPASAGAVPTAHLEAVDIREPDIEDDKIVGIDRQQRQCGRSGVGPIGRPGRFTKSPAEKIGQLGLVLDNQDAHWEYRPPGGKDACKVTGPDVRRMTEA